MSNTQAASSFLSNITKQERQALQRLVDYTNVESLPEIWPLAAKQFGKLQLLFTIPMPNQK